MTTVSSPRKRGCFSPALLRSFSMHVFPAQAGVFPAAATALGRRSSLPRASGGVSGTGKAPPRFSKSSPRKRGCFLSIAMGYKSKTVFPAQAGVFL